MKEKHKRKRSADLNSQASLDNANLDVREEICSRLNDLGIDPQNHSLFIGKELNFTQLLSFLKDFSDTRSGSNSKFSAKIIPEALRDDVAVLASNYWSNDPTEDVGNETQFNHVKMRLHEIFENFPPLYLYLYLLRTPSSNNKREYAEWFFYLFSLILVTKGNIQVLVFYFNFKGCPNKLSNVLKGIFNNFETLCKSFLNDWSKERFPKSFEAFDKQLQGVYSDDNLRINAINEAILEKLIYIFTVSYFNTNIYKINIMQFVSDIDEFLSKVKTTAQKINLPGSNLEIKLSAACKVHSRLFLYAELKKHFPGLDYSDWALLDKELFAIGNESLLSVLLKNQSRIKLIGMELSKSGLTDKYERLVVLKSLMNHSALLIDNIKGDADNIANLIENFSLNQLNIMLDSGCLDVLLTISGSKAYFKDVVMLHFKNRDFFEDCKNVVKLESLFKLFSASQYKSIYGLDFMVFKNLFDSLKYEYPYMDVYPIISSKECTVEMKRALASSLRIYSLVGNRNRAQFLESFYSIFPSQTSYLTEPAPLINYSTSATFTNDMFEEWKNMQSKRVWPKPTETERSGEVTNIENIKEVTSPLEYKK